ncbi:hypothetical protein EV178_004982 [Coemansia sp. RSA 1646]|nr:hypothetical protein EV178_004982 [Coemansia sp. RSA 1646]
MGGHEPGSQELGLCGWAKMMDKKATFVDKSAAIADVMSTDAGKVIAGMYPRRMSILVGVFDVRGIGLGSGLNNVESYMAHSGFVETQPTENPFQHAFGFTVHDVWHQGPPAEHMSLDFIDDAAVESIGSQEQPQFPPDVDKETREELADICMVRSGDTFHDMQSLGREPLQASTIMRLLYQAGYIVPIAKDRVGIPNSEVHRALEQFYERVATQLKISTNLLESIHEEMGIYKCDLQRFSRSLHSCMVSIPGLGEDTSERFYQTILSSYLFPATRSGYAIHNEAMMENGRADTLLFPAPGHLRSDSTPTSYYIFELKSYDGKTTPTSSKRTTVGNRHKVANHVFKQAMQAQTQIYERYYSTLADKARTCDLMYVVGISF